MFDWPATARSSSRAVQITSLAANAQLHLNGNDAFIEDSTALGSNSALTGLASIGAGAIVRAPKQGRGVDDRRARQ